MKTKYIILTIAITSTLMFLSLNPHSLLPLNFICLIPLFIIDKKTPSNKHYLLIVYVILIIWNSVSLYWIFKINWSAAIILFLINPLIQLIPFLILRHSNKSLKYLSFVCLWIGLEFIQQFGEFAFPYLSLGNSLANYPFLIQFYEYTGVLGGTLLILVINIILFLMLENYIIHKSIKKSILKFIPYLIIIITIPVIKGFDLNKKQLTSDNNIKVRAIHPYVNVRGEKYTLTNTELTNLYLNLSFINNSKNDLDFLLWPETSIKDAGWMNNLNNNLSLSIIKDSLKEHPKTNIISGAVLYEATKKEEISNANIRYQKQSDVFYKTYNAVIGINKGGVNNLKVKDKLVPVEEKIPYNGKLGILRKIAPSLGKYSFSNRKSNQSVFKFNNVIISPLICFESLFSNYVAKTVNDGAQALFVIINEGWFDNQFASDQFTAFSKIRAVENNRWVVRASNYGTTSFINPNGIETKRLNSKEQGYIDQTIFLNKKKTIFNYFGIYLGYIFLVCSIIFILIPLLINLKLKIKS